MRFAVSIILSLLLLALAGSCDGNHAVDETLDRAEAIMHSAPDSALAMLDSINPETLRGQRRRALHALLLSQAMDKNRIDTDNDSLINIAVSFYADDDDRRHRMLAYYYLGRVKYHADDNYRAAVNYMKALDLATEFNDNYWIGLISRHIGVTFSKSYNCAEQLVYARKAFGHMRLTGKHSHTCSTMIILIESLYDKGEFDEGISYAYRMLDTVKTYGLTWHEQTANALIGKGHLFKNEDRKAIPFLKRASAPNSGATYIDSAYLGIAYATIGESGLAKSILNKLDADSCLEYQLLKYEILKRSGETREALDALIITDSLFQEKFNKILADDQSRLIMELYKNEKDAAITQANANRTRMILTLSASCAVLALAVTAGLRLYRRQKRMINANVAIAEELRQILSLKDEQNEQAKEAINDLMSSRYETIDRLCGLCYEQKDNSALKARISDEVVSTINSMTSPDGKLPELERNADKFHGGLMSRFRSEMPGLKENDYLLMLFSTLGFSMAAITLLLKEDKIEAVYNRKSRLKSRIKRRNPPHVDDFLKAIT